MTDSQYKELVEYSTKMCLAVSGQKNHIDPSDLVSEAFLELFDFAENPEFMQMMKRKIRFLFKGNAAGQVSTYNDAGVLKRVATCKRCQSSKDETQFYLYTDKVTGLKNGIPPYCKSCIKEYIAEYCRTEKGKAVQSRAFKKYVQNNRDKWNAYIKQRYKKEKEELHDNYVKRVIRALLRNKGQKMQITKEMVEQKRAELKIKRNRYPLNEHKS